jgi:hypothetical protein
MSLISFLITLALAEIATIALDPLGVLAFRDSLAVILSANVDGGDLVTMWPGFYEADSWSFTVGDDGYRVTPNAPDGADCTIAIVGDSVTFGWGVNDGDTFTARLQEQYGDVRFINTGVSGYNAGDFEPAARRVKAAAYIYLQIGNDHGDSLVYSDAQYTPAGFGDGLSTYLLMVTAARMRVAKNKSVIWADREERYAGFLERDNLLIFTPSGNQWLVNEHGAIAAGAWESNISAYDKHPDADGHAQIANAISPYIGRFVQEVCK